MAKGREKKKNYGKKFRKKKGLYLYSASTKILLAETRTQQNRHDASQLWGIGGPCRLQSRKKWI